MNLLRRSAEVMVQIFIGLATEGTTDIRFFESIVRRTFQEIALRECRPDIDIDIRRLNTKKTGRSFVEYVKQASYDGVKDFGMMVLAVHADADRETYDVRRKYNIDPTQEELDKQGNDYCKILTPVIPVRMMEAWMLADKDLLKSEIGTTKTDNDLGINRDPESIADPKEVIDVAIRIAQSDLPKRRQRLTISDLYAIIGDKIGLDKLSLLNSYQRFQEEVRNTYRTLKYM